MVDSPICSVNNDVFFDSHDIDSAPNSLPPARTPLSVASVSVQNTPTSHRPSPRIRSPRKSIASVQPETPKRFETSQIQPTIQNIVATFCVGCKLQLKDITLRARNAEYNPKRFSAVIMRIRNPKTTVLIFHSGKIVCTGAKTTEEANRAARRTARIIQKLGFPARFLDFKIQNMVGSVTLGFRVRLAVFQTFDRLHSRYEAEIFPGLIYHIDNPKTVLLVFESGKMVITGAKEYQQILDAFTLVYPLLKRVAYPT